MGERHILSQKDFTTWTAVCAIDGPVEIRRRGNSHQCVVAYNKIGRRLRRDRSGTPRSARGYTCAACGFVAEDRVQNDLDHINGDREDHRLENMQTLCANCHRLKSFRPARFFELYPDQSMLSTYSPAGRT